MGKRLITPFLFLFPLQRGIVYFKGNEENYSTALKHKGKEKEKQKSYFCRACMTKIADRENLYRIEGSSRHVKQNPAGIIYNFLCFKAAAGCMTYGQPTLEYTWFPGLSWCYALCSSCQTHLGWFFQGNRRFFALIRERLA